MTVDEIINDLINKVLDADPTDGQLMANIAVQASNRLTGYNENGEFVGLPDPLPAQYLMDLNKRGEE